MWIELLTVDKLRIAVRIGNDVTCTSFVLFYPLRDDWSCIGSFSLI